MSVQRPRNLPPALLQRERELLALAERKALLDALASHALVFGAHARARASQVRRGLAEAEAGSPSTHRSIRRNGCHAHRERVLAWFRSLPMSSRAAVLTDDGLEGAAFARAVLDMRRRRTRYTRNASRTPVIPSPFCTRGSGLRAAATHTHGSECRFALCNQYAPNDTSKSRLDANALALPGAASSAASRSRAGGHMVNMEQNEELEVSDRPPRGTAWGDELAPPWLSAPIYSSSSQLLPAASPAEAGRRLESVWLLCTCASNAAYEALAQPHHIDGCQGDNSDFSRLWGSSIKMAALSDAAGVQSLVNDLDTLSGGQFLKADGRLNQREKSNGLYSPVLNNLNRCPSREACAEVRAETASKCHRAGCELQWLPAWLVQRAAPFGGFSTLAELLAARLELLLVRAYHRNQCSADINPNMSSPSLETSKSNLKQHRRQPQQAGFPMTMPAASVAARTRMFEAEWRHSLGHTLISCHHHCSRNRDSRLHNVFSQMLWRKLFANTVCDATSARTAKANSGSKTRRKTKCSGKTKAKRRGKGKGKPKLSQITIESGSTSTGTHSLSGSQEVSPSQRIASLTKVTLQLAIVRGIIKAATNFVQTNFSAAKPEVFVSEPPAAEVFACLVEQACFMSLDEVCCVHVGDGGAFDNCWRISQIDNAFRKSNCFRCEGGYVTSWPQLRAHAGTLLMQMLWEAQAESASAALLANCNAGGDSSLISTALKKATPSINPEQQHNQPQQVETQWEWARSLVFELVAFAASVALWREKRGRGRSLTISRDNAPATPSKATMTALSRPSHPGTSELAVSSAASCAAESTALSEPASVPATTPILASLSTSTSFSDRNPDSMSEPWLGPLLLQEFNAWLGDDVHGGDSTGNGDGGGSRAAHAPHHPARVSRLAHLFDPLSPAHAKTSVNRNEQVQPQEHKQAIGSKTLFETQISRSDNKKIESPENPGFDSEADSVHQRNARPLSTLFVAPVVHAMANIADTEAVTDTNVADDHKSVNEESKTTSSSACVNGKHASLRDRVRIPCLIRSRSHSHYDAYSEKSMQNENKESDQVHSCDKRSIDQMDGVPDKADAADAVNADSEIVADNSSMNSVYSEHHHQRQQQRATNAQTSEKSSVANWDNWESQKLLKSPPQASGRRRRSLSSGLGFVDACEEDSDRDGNGTTGAAWQLVLKRGRQLRMRKARDDTAEAEKDIFKKFTNSAFQNSKVSTGTTDKANTQVKEGNWLRAKVRREFVPQRQGAAHAVSVCSVATQTAPSITLSHTRGHMKYDSVAADVRSWARNRPGLRARASTFVGAGSKSTAPSFSPDTITSHGAGSSSPSLKASRDVADTMTAFPASMPSSPTLKPVVLQGTKPIVGLNSSATGSSSAQHKYKHKQNASPKSLKTHSQRPTYLAAVAFDDAAVGGRCTAWSQSPTTCTNPGDGTPSRRPRSGSGHSKDGVSSISLNSNDRAGSSSDKFSRGGAPNDIAGGTMAMAWTRTQSQTQTRAHAAHELAFAALQQQLAATRSENEMLSAKLNALLSRQQKGAEAESDKIIAMPESVAQSGSESTPVRAQSPAQHVSPSHIANTDVEADTRARAHEYALTRALELDPSAWQSHAMSRRSKRRGSWSAGGANAAMAAATVAAAAAQTHSVEQNSVQTSPWPSQRKVNEVVPDSQWSQTQETHSQSTLPLLLPPIPSHVPMEHALESALHELRLERSINAFVDGVLAQARLQRSSRLAAFAMCERATRALWPRAQLKLYGSFVTELALPNSDLDIVVSLPRVQRGELAASKQARGLGLGVEPFEQNQSSRLQELASVLKAHPSVLQGSLKTITHTAIPLISLVAQIQRSDVSGENGDRDRAKSGRTGKAKAKKQGKSRGKHEHISLLQSHLRRLLAAEHCSMAEMPRSSCSNLELDTSSQQSSARIQAAQGSVGGQAAGKMSTSATQESVTEVLAVRLDVSFASAAHNGFACSSFISSLMQRHASLQALILVLKQFLAERSLGTAYTGGLSSYALTLMAACFLEHSNAAGRTTSDGIKANLGMHTATADIRRRSTKHTNATESTAQASVLRPRLAPVLLGFLDFFGSRFDPARTAVAVAKHTFVDRRLLSTSVADVSQSLQGAALKAVTLTPVAGTAGTGMGTGAGTMERDRVRFEHDPLVVVDPLSHTNNVGRNCFRFRQIQRAFAEAYTALSVRRDSSAASASTSATARPLPAPASTSVSPSASAAVTASVAKSSHATTAAAPLPLTLPTLSSILTHADGGRAEPAASAAQDLQQLLGITDDRSRGGHGYDVLPSPFEYATHRVAAFERERGAARGGSGAGGVGSGSSGLRPVVVGRWDSFDYVLTHANSAELSTRRRCQHAHTHAHPHAQTPSHPHAQQQPEPHAQQHPHAHAHGTHRSMEHTNTVSTTPPGQSQPQAPAQYGHPYAYEHSGAVRRISLGHSVGGQGGSGLGAAQHGTPPGGWHGHGQEHEQWQAQWQAQQQGQNHGHYRHALDDSTIAMYSFSHPWYEQQHEYYSYGYSYAQQQQQQFRMRVHDGQDRGGSGRNIEGNVGRAVN